MYPGISLENSFRITSLHTAFKDNFDKDYDFSGERHNFWEMVIVTDGEIGITAGENAFTLKKGWAVLHEPLEFHRIRGLGSMPATAIIFSFTADFMPEYRSKIFEIIDVKKPGKILKDILSHFDFSGISLSRIKEKSEIYAQLTMKNLECFILDTISRQRSSKKIIKSVTAEHYSTIINTMQENVDKNLSVYDIAVLCHMSETNLKKIFSYYAGMGVMEYFNNLKITSAIPMLKNGMTVQETATALGFTNQNYFSTVFKRINGRSPSYYK